ncbi:MAG TPA: hypothetical protein V6C99_01855 [Oculatellaceae cyanobacterium]|jgi:hypothetical protein
MYRKLLPYVKRFVFVRQGSFNRYYEGKLLAVDSETIQLQSYRKDGSEEELWTISLDTITEFSIGGRHLAELELKVSYLASSDMGEDGEDSSQMPSKQGNPESIESQVDEF